MADDGNSDHDGRMFFDKSKAAFRAGRAINSQWDDSNVGGGSVAFGYNTQAIGENSFSGGSYADADSNAETGFVYGEEIYVGGYNSFALGSGGDTFTDRMSVTGDYAYALGRNVVVGDGSNNGNAGGYGDAAGSYSMAIGLGESTGGDAAWPRITGSNSLGIFIGNQTGVEVSQSNVVSIMGGNVGVGTTQPDTDVKVDVDGAVKVSSSGSETCDGALLGAIRYNSSTGKMQICRP